MEQLIYWERQDPKTKMCALHCLNSLLQGPVFTEAELSEISLQLDSKESELLNNTGNQDYTGELLGFRNVSESGHFNVTVLEKALLRRNISCEYCSLAKLQLFHRLESIGYICNIQSHWFCLRKPFNDKWFILDSLKEGPVPVEDGWVYDYLSDIIKSEKGVIFSILPLTIGAPLPIARRSHFVKLQPHQLYLTLSEVYERCENMEDTGGEKSFLYKNGANVSKPVSWPTTGGIRLDQEIVPEDCIERLDEGIKLAVRLDSGRVTKSFKPDSPINELFKWVESKSNAKFDELDFYSLIQTTYNRKFIKYSNGSIELICDELAPLDVTNRSLSELELASHDMLILRLS